MCLVSIMVIRTVVVIMLRQGDHPHMTIRFSTLVSRLYVLIDRMCGPCKSCESIIEVIFVQCAWVLSSS